METITLLMKRTAGTLYQTRVFIIYKVALLPGLYFFMGSRLRVCFDILWQFYLYACYKSRNKISCQITIYLNFFIEAALNA